MLSEDDFRVFAVEWAKYDKKATCFMPANDLPRLFQSLRPPMGFGKEYTASRLELRLRICQLRLPIYPNDMVHFRDVSQALGRRIVERRARELGEDPTDITQTEALPDWDKKYVCGASVSVSLWWRAGSRCEQI
jgi:hypothetical protein